MAAPDIVALAAAGIANAWALTVSVQVSATIKLAPVVTPASDGGSASIAWGHTLAAKPVIKYDETDEDEDGASTEEARGSTVRRKHTVFLVRATDLPTGVIPNTDTQIIVGAQTWEIHVVERIPGDGMFILKSRQ